MSVENAISLFDLNQRVKEVLFKGFTNTIWITGEISQISKNRSGHCYLELIDKNPDNDSILASSRATIWASRYRMIKPYFETTTGQSLSSGIKIMVSVKVEYHERYGLSLNIIDIEPSFTIGDLARRRLEIIRKLEEEGVISMNKELELPIVPQRIAVISSDTAAGYGDFIDQLKSNSSGYKYHIKLYSSAMQGEGTGKSIISALNKIADLEEEFDLVAIIRGGGAKTDLSSFDDFDLAYFITQFPLPVISGIGHERDESIVDLVAHTSCKTPTAVAEFIIEQADYFVNELDNLRHAILESSRNQLSNWKEDLISDIKDIKAGTDKMLINEKMALKESALRGSSATNRYIFNRQELINKLKLNFRSSLRRFLEQKTQYLANRLNTYKLSAVNSLNLEKNRLHLLNQEAELQNPIRILKRGYSISIQNGKVLKSVKDVERGKVIRTRLSDGSIRSEVIDEL